MYRYHKENKFLNINDLPLNQLNSKSHFVIFGTGHLGVVCLNALRALKIEPSAFCDSNPDSCNTQLLNVTVKTLQQTASEHRDAVFVIAAFRHDVRDQMCKLLLDNMKDNGTFEAYFPMSLFKWYYINHVKRPIILSEFEDTIRRCFTEEGNDYNVDTSQVHINQHCTLLCKHCSNCVPYLPVRRHENSDEIIATVQGFCEIIDSVRTLTLVGGEGLLHPEIVKIMEGITKCSKVMAITIVTNGTWIPNDDVFIAMSRFGIALRISGYKDVSDKIDELASKCIEFGVVFFREARSNTFINYGTIQQQINGFKRTYEENIIVFNNCIYISREHTRVGTSILARGRWYLCDRYVILANLGAIDENTLDGTGFVSVIKNVDKQDDRKKQFLNAIMCECLPVCDHCKFPQTVIPAGEQLTCSGS